MYKKNVKNYISAQEVPHTDCSHLQRTSSTEALFVCLFCFGYFLGGSLCSDKINALRVSGSHWCEILLHSCHSLVEIREKQLR